MEVQYDQEPFARPRYGYIVMEGRHEEQRGRISFVPLHKGCLESEENLVSRNGDAMYAMQRLMSVVFLLVTGYLPQGKGGKTD
jgi:hypothetical protein